MHAVRVPTSAIGRLPLTSLVWALRLTLAALVMPVNGFAMTLLYDAGLGTTPDAQGWTYSAIDRIPGNSDGFTVSAVQSFTGGVTNLDSVGDIDDYAGYLTHPPFSTTPSHPNMPLLNRTQGYSVLFDVQLLAENHSSADRAGFSMIALGSDGLGIELGFWDDRIWAQDQGFSHGEEGLFNSWDQLVSFELAVLGSTYELLANSNAILAGSLRDYSGQGWPYTAQNFLFFGDDTSQAEANFNLSRIAVISTPVPAALPLMVSALLGFGFFHRRRRRSV